MGQDIRRLTNLAYPSAPADVKDTLVKEQFIDSFVSSDMRLRIKQARPTNINDTVRHAVELEAFNRAEKKTLEGQGYMRTLSSKDNAPENRPENQDVEDMKKSIDEIKEFIVSFGKRSYQKPLKHVPSHEGSTGNSSGTSFRANSDNKKVPEERSCYECGEKGHLRYNCPTLKGAGFDSENTSQNKPSVNSSSNIGSGL
jgi:hypothetical protein